MSYKKFKIPENGSCYVAPVEGKNPVLITEVNGTVYFDYRGIREAYRSLKGFRLDHECTEVYKECKPEDSREMVSISAVISAIYQTSVSPIIREQMCIRLLNAPVVLV
ncbi:hypothetical protein [Blautia sp. MSJ-36]|uniref:hypothetical protein n=1 Tax=Blautia sp. MSJ-36 TaxID=2841530 RepID=UPI001C101352|nr:hypothetical protein [Blautia sp. MSJ-36]MBU5445725.1 hypothetical protein [Blautia sp. MSJ-36]